MANQLADIMANEKVDATEKNIVAHVERMGDLVDGIKDEMKEVKKSGKDIRDRASGVQDAFLDVSDSMAEMRDTFTKMSDQVSGSYVELHAHFDRMMSRWED